MDGSGDLAEVVQRLARIHGNQVAGNAVAKAITHGLERGLGRSKGFEVTEVGDNELVALVVGTVAFDQGLAQVVQACAC